MAFLSIRSRDSERERYERLVAVLRARRVFLGYSQPDLDFKIGLCVGHVQKWERLIRRPTGFNLIAWIMGLEGDFRVLFPEGYAADEHPTDECPSIQLRRSVSSAT